MVFLSTVERCAGVVEPLPCLYDPCASANWHDHIVGDAEMPGKAYSTADDAARTDAGAARNPCHSGNGRVVADRDVVSDLDLVVEPHPIANTRITDGTAIGTITTKGLVSISFASVT